MLKSNILKPKQSKIGTRAKTLRDLTAYAQQAPAPEHERPAFDPMRMELTFVIPDFRPGAGGHGTIFKLIHHLERFGHKITLLIQNPSVHRTADEARQTIARHFVPVEAEVSLFHRQLPSLEGDGLIATDRFTCFPVQAMAGFRRKFYLVQDYETLFYPMGTEALLTEQTYQMGFDCLCAGDWLAGLMGEKYGAWACSWPLAYDPQHYYAAPAPPAESRRIAVYARHATPRRAVELAVMALDILAERGVQFHADFFGGDVAPLEADYTFTDHGLLSDEKLGMLYRETSIGLAFSGTNHSLVGTEMMASGLPVVELDLEHTRKVFPADCVHFVPPSPVAIADGLSALLEDDARRQALRQAGLDRVQPLSWQSSARIVEQALAERMGAERP